LCGGEEEAVKAAEVVQSNERQVVQTEWVRSWRFRESWVAINVLGRKEE